MTALITVIGVLEADALPAAARSAIAAADVVVGSDRVRRLVGADLPTAGVDDIGPAVAQGQRVCVLASGDPGFFGIVRVLAERFGRSAIRVIPAPSSVSVAFARLGLPWDDATVVSAHGRPLADAAAVAACAVKVAVLTGPEAPPEALGAALEELGATHEFAAVCGRLGTADEAVCVTDLPGLRQGSWDPLAVVVLWSGTGVAERRSLAWGRPDARYAHRDGMITKAEVRSVVIGLLALPGPGGSPVLWDLGAGSGSVGVECASLAPWLDVVAVDRDPVATATVTANARTHGVALRVVTGEAPRCLDDLPDPDRVFVGGGGLDVVDTVRRRLRPGGVIVATHAALDRAAAAATMLGHLTEITASHGRRLPDGGWRLEGANPVFVTWGPPA